ncbi:MAG: phosphatase PAP2 family protein [Bacteroidota bacterium]
MMNKIKLLTAAIAVLVTLNSCYAQPSGGISNLSPQEPVTNHYRDLQKLSALPRQEMAWMDAISYPPSQYRNHTMLFALSKPVYLTSDQVDFLVHSVNFPANSSKQTRAELDFLLELQAKRTPQQVERVMTIARIGYWPDAGWLESHPSYQRNIENLFFEVYEVMGKEHNPSKHPETVKLLKGAMVDMRLMEFAVKYHLLRARPYQLETKLEPLVTIGSPSFASGHTLWAYVQAYILAELIPEKRAEFIKLAYEIGYSRELMGVHYPSDEETARLLAHRMVWLMWHTQTFQEDFVKAQEEWE